MLLVAMGLVSQLRLATRMVMETRPEPRRAWGLVLKVECLYRVKEILDEEILDLQD